MIERSRSLQLASQRLSKENRWNLELVRSSASTFSSLGLHFNLSNSLCRKHLRPS